MMTAPARSACRVVAWGTGHLGTQGVAQIIRDPALDLVGLKVATPAKIGQDVGTIVGTAPVGVVATGDAASLLALAPDCVAYFANSAGREAEAVRDLVPFLENGVNVVTISHFDVQYPRHGQPALVAPLLAASAAGGQLDPAHRRGAGLRVRPASVRDPVGLRGHRHDQDRRDVGCAELWRAGVASDVRVRR